VVGTLPDDSGVLFVCTGNVCRSPMAEGFLRHHLALQALTLPVSSAGILGWNSAGATDHTLTALREHGVALDGHISRKIDRSIIDSATLIVTMTNDHADAVRLRSPEAAPRTFVLGQIVRLGEKHEAEDGPSGGQPLPVWLEAVDGRRDARRRALTRDEIRDPLGEPLPAYQELAVQLDDLTARLTRLLGGTVNSEARITTGAVVGQDGANR
jgi:protein-tyrosine-phosphatase